MHRVLFIGKVWPEPNSSAAGTRILQLMNYFAETNAEVVFACAANEGEFTFNVEKAGAKKEKIELNSKTFDDFVKQLMPDMVVFDRFTSEEQYGWRIAENCPSCIRILDTEDLHFLREARTIANKEKRSLEIKDLLNDVAKREIASVYRCDLTLIISEFEMDLLKEQFKVNPAILHYIPLLNDLTTDKEIKSQLSFGQRKNFISIGNFLHEPNWNSVLFLKEEVWPLIRKKLPDAEINIYGAYPSQKVFALNDAKNGFLIKGRADNVEEVYKDARICLAPLRIGAGLKGKLMDAMKYGTPNITTNIGVEGMKADMEWSGIIADDAMSFAHAAVELYTNEVLWEKCRQNGFNILNELFEKKKHFKLFTERLNALRKDIIGHRQNNFIGSMLNYQTVQASKYMSLWIEAKNKLNAS